MRAGRQAPGKCVVDPWEGQEEGSPRAHICEMTPGKKAYLRTAAALIIAYTLGASVPFLYF